MSRNWSNFWSNYSNLLPGKYRGVKRGGKGRIKPSKYQIMMERNPSPLDDYKPYHPKPNKRRDKRGQSKPR